MVSFGQEPQRLAAVTLKCWHRAAREECILLIFDKDFGEAGESGKATRIMRRRPGTYSDAER